MIRVGLGLLNVLCDAHPQFSLLGVNYQCEGHSCMSYHCETHSQLCFVMLYVLSVRLTHSYSRVVRLTHT